MANPLPRPGAESVLVPAVLFLWGIMYVITIMANRLIYAEARARGQGAELWVLINIVPALAGLLLILLSLFTADIRAVWLLTITGALLVVLGPIIYLVLPRSTLSEVGKRHARG